MTPHVRPPLLPVHSLAAAALAAACGSAPTPVGAPAEPLQSSVPAPDPTRLGGPIDDGRVYAIASVTDMADECSGAGGEHYVFTIEQPAHLRGKLAHAGGHALYLGLLAAHPAARYVVELDVLAAPMTVGGAGWCLGHLPAFDARVSRALPVDDADHAARAFADAVDHGMPPAQVAVAAPTGPEDIGVARVTGFDTNGAVIVESLDGPVPARFSLPDARPWRGDILVIASEAHGGDRTVTRLMIPRDRDTAMRWADHVRANGWPEAPRRLPDFGDMTTSRWIIRGSVVEGTGDCGPSIEAPHGYGSSYILPKMVAPAPDGVSVGDEIIAVVSARFRDDACGNNLHTSRVYRAPGVTDNDIWSGGIPAGLELVVD